MSISKDVCIVTTTEIKCKNKLWESQGNSGPKAISPVIILELFLSFLFRSHFYSLIIYICRGLYTCIMTSLSRRNSSAENYQKSKKYLNSTVRNTNWSLLTLLKVPF